MMIDASLERTACVYALYDERDLTHVRYIGVSTNPYARLEQHVKEAYGYDKRRAAHKGAWIRSISGMAQVVVRVLESHPSAEEAYAAEIWWIDHLRSTGHNLTNVSTGGEGWRVNPWSIPTSRAKLEEAFRRRSTDPAWLENVTSQWQTYWADPEHRQQQSARVSAHFSDPANRAKTSKATKTAMASTDVRERISAGVKKAVAETDYVERMTAAKRTPEGRAKASQAARTSMAKPGAKEHLSSTVAEQWKDPEYRRKHLAWWSENPEKVAEIVKKNSDLWKNEEYRNWRRDRIIAGRARAKAKRNEQTLEVLDDH